MSFSGSRRKVQSDGFEERLAEALRKRLAPNTTLTVQKFAHRIGATERRVWSWLGGAGIRGKVLADMMKLFGADFVDEVLGRPTLKPDLQQRITTIRQELDRLLEEGRV